MEIGDRVRLLPTSRYYEQCLNSIGKPGAGKIIDERNSIDFRWRIRWENGHENSYGDHDIAPFPETNEGYLFRLRKLKELAR